MKKENLECRWVYGREMGTSMDPWISWSKAPSSVLHSIDICRWLVPCESRCTTFTCCQQTFESGSICSFHRYGITRRRTHFSHNGLWQFNATAPLIMAPPGFPRPCFQLCFTPKSFIQLYVSLT